MWGDGLQTRSFTFIDDCVEGILRITKSDFRQPLNLGSCEMVSRAARQAVCVGGWVGGCGWGGATGGWGAGVRGAAVSRPFVTFSFVSSMPPPLPLPPPFPLHPPHPPPFSHHSLLVVRR